MANDADVYGRRHNTRDAKQEVKTENTSPLFSLQQYVTLHVINNFDDVATLHSHLDDINLLDANRLRPSWDSYFMVNSRGTPLAQELTRLSRLWHPSLP